jgi:hypothetical protein
MGPLLVKCTERMIDQLNETRDVEINVSDYLKRFVLKLIQHFLINF